MAHGIKANENVHLLKHIQKPVNPAQQLAALPCISRPAECETPSSPSSSSSSSAHPLRSIQNPFAGWAEIMRSFVALAAGSAGLLALANAQITPAHNEILDVMFPTFDSWPQSRVIAKNGPLGAGSKENVESGGGGALFEIKDVEELKRFVSNGLPETVSSPVAIVVDEKMMTAEVFAGLVEINEKSWIDNVIVTPVQDLVMADVKRNPDPKSEWNTAGDGLSALTLPFSVTMVKSLADGEVIREKARNNEKRGYADGASSRGSRFQFYLGKTSVTSSECINLRRCDPLGGLSVWGTVGGFPDGREKVLITSGMDSTAFLHDLAFGRNKGASNIVASLLAAKALSSADGVNSLPRQVAVALFQGEAWGRIGSKRFVKDLSGNGCSSLDKSKWGCGDPLVFSRAWENVTVNQFSHVIAVDQVASGVGAANYFVHTLPSDVESDSLRNLVINSATGASLSVSASSDSNRVPPSPLDSFVQAQFIAANGTSQKWKGTGVVFAGYDRSFAETNPAYHSDMDVTSDLINENSIAENIAKVATTIARTAYVAAGGNASVANSAVIVDPVHAEALWLCFAKQFACDLVATTLGLTVDQVADMKASFGVSASSASRDGPITLFTSVYRPQKVERNSIHPVERFVKLYLSQLALPQQTTEDFTCGTDLDCTKMKSNVTCPFGRSSLICLEKKCVCPSFYYHDAIPISIKYDAATNWYKVVDLNEDLYTEPIWSQPELTLFFESPGSATSIALVVVGVLSSFGTWFALSAAKKKLSGTKLKLE